MSRRAVEETTDRLRPGKPQDASSAPTHVRNSVSFLNPDASIGATNLERAPSLNRLHAQSSTETSGLGETVTSGFSSQESVLSYLPDDKDRGAGGGVSFVERSRRRPGGSPGSGRTLTEQELANREDNFRAHSGLSKQHISNQQRQQRPQPNLTVPQPGHRAASGDIQAFHGDDQRRDYDSRLLEQHQKGDRRQKPVRDTGGRSLTPQQAKEEFEARQRKLRQVQDRDAVLYASTKSSQVDLRSGLVPSSAEKSRKPAGSNQKQKEKESFELSNFKEQRPGDARVRLHSSGSNSSKADSKFVDHRSGFKSEKSDRAHTETSKPSRKETSAHSISSRPGGAGGSRETSDVHRSSFPSSESKDSADLAETASTSRGRSSSQTASRDREKRAASRSREQLKSQSSSPKTNSDDHNESSGSKKSYETQILNRQSPKPKSSSSGELTEGGSKSQEPGYTDASRSFDKYKRRDNPSTSDVKKTSLKSSDSQQEVDHSANVSQTRWSKESENSHKRLPQEVHAHRKRSDDQVEIPVTSASYKHRNEQIETGRSSRQPRDYEQRRSVDKHLVNEQTGTNYARRQRQHEDYSDDIRVRESSRDDVIKNGRSDAQNNSGIVQVGEVRDIDLGPILIRGAAVVRVHDAKQRDQTIHEKDLQGDNPTDRSRDRRVTKDRTSERGRSRETSGSRTFDTRNQSPGDLSLRGKVELGSHPQLPAGSSNVVRSSGRSVASVHSANAEAMNYERLFHQASRDMNGTGGGGASRTYPASLSAGQSSTRPASGVPGQNYNSMSPNTQGPPSTHSQPLAGAVHISSPSSQARPAPLNTSTSYTSSPASPRTVPTVHLTSPDNLDHTWERRDSRSSNRSTTSNRFLGVNTGSAWTKWSRERRASYRRRLEKMEQANPQPTTDASRISTPIKKARQEGLKFVHPDLEATYISEDDLNELRRHKQQQVQAMRVIERSQRRKFRLKNELKLTPEQWHMLQEFWNHPVFVRARFLGIIISFVSLIFLVISITHHSWLRHSEWNSTIVEGLWINCSQSTVIPNSAQECVVSNGSNWQNVVIGLMIFAVTFGLLASILSVCGVFTNPLPRKIYYFHSAGEIFFICALSATVALFVFPTAVELDDSIHSHHYSTGYGLGWAGTICLLAAAICMSLDDLVRESSRTKCCLWCWRNKQSERSELRQV